MDKNDMGDDVGKGVSLGTTIMAVEFEGGVVICADSRTTTGSYISNRVTDKIDFVHKRIACLRSGSAADTQMVSDIVKYWLDVHGMELGGNMATASMAKNSLDNLPSVYTAAHFFQRLCYTNKAHLSASIICAGWDPEKGGQVYSIPLGGALIKQSFSIGGSGSTYIYGHCDATYKEGMDRESCEQFAAEAVSLAMKRDGSSGGVIRLATITKDGIFRKHISPSSPDWPQHWDQ